MLLVIEIQYAVAPKIGETIYVMWYNPCMPQRMGNISAITHQMNKQRLWEQLQDFFYI